MLQKIKVIVFDFDNTLYNGDVWTNYNNHVLKILEKILPHKEAKELLDASVNVFQGNVHIDHIITLLKQKGYDYEKFLSLVKENVYVHPCEVEVISNDFLKELSKHYEIYCLSMSNENYLDFYFDKYKIDRAVFKEVLSADLLAEDKSKVPILLDIIKKENIKSTELLMVGDSYSHDILPAKKAGVQYLHYNSGNFNQLYDYFIENNILNCEKYKK